SPSPSESPTPSPSSSPEPSPSSSPSPSVSPSPSPSAAPAPLPSLAPAIPCDPLTKSFCSGQNGGASYRIATVGATTPTFDQEGSFSNASLATPITINIVDFGKASLPAPARTSVSSEAYVDGFALSMTQESSVFGTVFYEPQEGTVTFSVTGPAPDGFVYMIEGFQAMGCSPADAWQAAVNGTAGACSWAHTAAGLYAQFDPVTLTAGTGGIPPAQWNGIYVLQLQSVAEVEVPSSSQEVDPQTTGEIQGAAGSVQFGGEFAYSATVDGDESISAFAAYFPGEMTPVGGESSARRRARALLAAGGTVTVKVASGLLFLKRGNNSYAPAKGALEFRGVGDRWVTSFFVSVHQYTDCAPGQFNKVASFANCTWAVVPNDISLTYNATAQKMALGNLGSTTWNSVYMLSAVMAISSPPSPLAPPPPPPAAVKSGGIGGIGIIIVACIAGGCIVVGLPLLAIGSRRRRNRSEEHQQR
ncbi:hypothetical protein KFL_007730040, partial [Klebsormidium nitens]